jgi:hypothetical protein
MIDSQCSVNLSNDIASVLIDPAYIVDVPTKGKKFLLVIETCYENQKDLGPAITALYGQSIMLQIGKPGAAPKIPPAKTESSEEKKTLLMGLHRLFLVQKFQAFIFSKCLKADIAVNITDEKTCKAAFKQLVQVGSCRDLSEDAINSWRNAFNEWINGGGR